MGWRHRGETAARPGSHREYADDPVHPSRTALAKLLAIIFEKFFPMDTGRPTLPSEPLRPEAWILS